MVTKIISRIRLNQQLMKTSLKGELLKWLFFCGLLFFSYKFFSSYVIDTTITMGESMTPTLRNGDFKILQKWIYQFRNPKRGEIVVITFPLNQELLIKRVIGLPNDTLEIKNNNVYINHKLLEEPYLPPYEKTLPDLIENKPFIIKPDCYFVLGDNRSVSFDSRIFGMVKREWIQGLVKI